MKSKICLTFIAILISATRIENYFPNREVYLIEMLSSWTAGGGGHCHTNDQPAFSIIK